jgi:uncharacterized protein with FMN-binding domain
VRRATSVIVGVASATAIGASWAAGLTPKHGGVALVSPPPAAARSNDGATRGSTDGRALESRPSSGKSSSSSGSKSTSGSKSRTIDGGVAQTQFGNVQVSITVSGSKITNVHALQLTDSSGHSVQISQYAAPILRQEALAAQSAQIDAVSGATYTSEGYMESLQSAIDAAHLG